MSYKKRLIFFISFIIVFLAVIPLIILYATGYSFDQTLGFIVRGGIYVYVAEPNASVYIGNDLKKTTGLLQREVLVKNLVPQQYLVLVAHNDYWPWAKTVTVAKGEVVALYPLLVPKVFNQKEIPILDPEFARAIALFNPNLKNATTSLSSRRIKVWVEEGLVFVQWIGNPNAAPAYTCRTGNCTHANVVFHTDHPILHIDFYPDRDDAIMLTLDGGVYAVELDNRPYQNLYPIYQGNDPDFRISNNTIYVRDNDFLERIDL